MMNNREVVVTFSNGRRVTVVAVDLEQARRLAYRLEPSVPIASIEFARRSALV